MSFSNPTEASQALQSIISSSVQDESTDIPGLSFVVVSKDGSTLFQQSAGSRGTGTGQPLKDDSIFWMASCTKLVTTIACLQLVEKGKWSLDDGHELEALLPELKEREVLKADGTTEPKRNGITLRMLLTHTAGFGYTFFDERLRDWSFPAGKDEFTGDFSELDQPLLFQPGEGWEYGVRVQDNDVP